MLTGGFPSRSGPSSFNWKNKRGDEESAYGIAAEIAGLQTRPPATGYALGRAAFRAKSPRFIDRQSPVVPDGDNLRAVRQIPLRAQRRSGTGYAMFSRFPPPGPVCARRKPHARTLRSPGRVCHSTLLLSARPVTGAGGAFLPCPGLGVFRHSRVSGKRSQTLNSLGGKT